jgi:hypothetical protein
MSRGDLLWACTCAVLVLACGTADKRSPTAGAVAALGAKDIAIAVRVDGGAVGSVGTDALVQLSGGPLRPGDKVALRPLLTAIGMGSFKSVTIVGHRGRRTLGISVFDTGRNPTLRFDGPGRTALLDGGAIAAEVGAVVALELVRVTPGKPTIVLQEAIPSDATGLHLRRHGHNIAVTQSVLDGLEVVRVEKNGRPVEAIPLATLLRRHGFAAASGVRVVASGRHIDLHAQTSDSSSLISRAFVVRNRRGEVQLLLDRGPMSGAGHARGGRGDGTGAGPGDGTGRSRGAGPGAGMRSPDSKDPKDPEDPDELTSQANPQLAALGRGGGRRNTVRNIQWIETLPADHPAH